VTVTSLPISATSGRDFKPVSTVVEFAAGEKEKTVAVEALADADRELDEVFVVAIGSPTGDAATGTPSSVAVTVPGPASTGHTGADSGVGGASLAFGSKTLVTLALAAVHVGPRGPVKVRVANANSFTVAGELATRSGRVQLRRRPFTVAAHARKTVKLDLPKTLRRSLKRKHRLSLRLTAKVRDPAGHRRTVARTVTPKLRPRA
jgi:hypothetical protein